MLGFLAGSLGVMLLIDTRWCFLSVLMIPVEICTILLFNRRIVSALVRKFETWFVIINMLVPIAILHTVVEAPRNLFVSVMAPGLISSSFMDAYPANMRIHVIKQHFVFYFVYWSFWVWVLHFEDINDKKISQ